MAALGSQPKSASINVDINIIIHHTDSDVIVLVQRFGRQPLRKHTEALTEYLTSRYSQ